MPKIKRSKDKWARVVDNSMRVFGDTNYDKKIIRVNKKKSKKTAPGEVIKTIIHEEEHRLHPKMHEKTVYKKAREMIKRMNHNQKQRHYARYKGR